MRLWAAANWLEREVFDLYGIRFRGPPGSAPHLPLRRVRGPPAAQGLPEGAAPAARRARATRRSRLGRARAAIPTRRDEGRSPHRDAAPHRWGRRIRRRTAPSGSCSSSTASASSRSDVQVGYLHRGFEKECESGTWYQAIPYTDRLNYNSAILNNVGYCLAVEKLFGIEIARRVPVPAHDRGRALAHRRPLHLPRRARARARRDDAVPLRHRGARAGLGPPRELCGARVTSNYVRIGGAAARRHARASRALLRELSSRASSELLADFDDVAARRTRSSSSAWRTPACSPLEQLIALRRDRAAAARRRRAATTCARPSRTSSTTRSTSTSRSATTGDNYDRFLVRSRGGRAELAHHRAVHPVLELPGRPVDVDDPRVRWPAKGRVFNRMEELIAAVQARHRGHRGRRPARSTRRSRAANGELGFYVVSDGSGQALEGAAVAPPSFTNTQRRCAT